MSVSSSGKWTILSNLQATAMIILDNAHRQLHSSWWLVGAQQVPAQCTIPSLGWIRNHDGERNMSTNSSPIPWVQNMGTILSPVSKNTKTRFIRGFWGKAFSGSRLKPEFESLCVWASGNTKYQLQDIYWVCPSPKWIHWFLSLMYICFHVSVPV